MIVFVCVILFIVFVILAVFAIAVHVCRAAGRVRECSMCGTTLPDNRVCGVCGEHNELEI